MATNRHAIPEELRRKVPSGLLSMSVDHVVFPRLLGLGFCIFILYGPWVGPPDHNGFRYLLAPLVCPWVPALYYFLSPFTPYRGPAATFAGMIDRDKEDADAHRLVEIFRSREAYRALVRITLGVSGILFTVMAPITLIFWCSLSWSIQSPWLIPGLVSCCIGCLIAIGSKYVGWGLTTWATEKKIQRTS